MFLGMELFLLVRHTHPPLRAAMEDVHTQKHSHNLIHTEGELVEN